MKLKISFFCLFIYSYSFAQKPGDSLFSTLIHNIHITFPVSTWYDTLTANYSQIAVTDTNIYYPCTITIDGKTLTNVGARFKGNSSYGHPNQKKSIKLDFEEFVPNQRYDSLKQLNLNNGFNDPTFLREKIYLDFCRAKGLEAPRCAYANVYINGNLWGFYTIVEEIDKTYLKTQYGNKGGNLFKGDPSGHLKWQGPNQSSYYNSYELKTNETANNWSDLVNFINKINNTSSNQWTDSVSAYFNIYQYLKHYAATMLFATLDSYTGSGHNFYLYHNTSTNKFEFIEWDVNGSFGRHHPSGQGLTNEALLNPFWVPTPSGSRPLHEKILQQPLLKQQYVTHLCDYLYTYFDTASMYTRFDTMANNIRQYIYADPRKQFTNNDFDSNILTDFGANTPGLKKFVLERNNYLNTALSSWGCSLSSVNSISADNAILIYPNPATNFINIQCSKEMIGSVFYICDMLGRVIITSKLNNENTIVPIENISKGIYFIKLNNTSVKFITF